MPTPSEPPTQPAGDLWAEYCDLQRRYLELHTQAICLELELSRCRQQLAEYVRDEEP